MENQTAFNLAAETYWGNWKQNHDCAWKSRTHSSHKHWGAETPRPRGRNKLVKIKPWLTEFSGLFYSVNKTN